MLFTLNPFITQVFPTFKKNEWPGWEGGIDLNKDGIIQDNEEIKDTNQHNSDVLDIDDEDIVAFFRQNITDIPQDKLTELVPLLFDYIQEHPIGDIFYAGDSSLYAEEVLSIIISHNTSYLPQVENLLSSDNFLIRWSAVNILEKLDIKDNTIRERIKNNLTDLYQSEQNKKIVNKKPSVPQPYYPVDELYSNYYLNTIIYALKEHEKYLHK